MRSLLIAMVMSTAASSAYAGCANFTDGSLSTPAPRVSICVDDRCEQTTTDFACGNVNGAQFGYQNGWRIEIGNEKGVAVQLAPNGFEIVRLEGPDFKRIVCRPVDDNPDACF